MLQVNRALLTTRFTAPVGEGVSVYFNFDRRKMETVVQILHMEVQGKHLNETIFFIEVNDRPSKSHFLRPLQPQEQGVVSVAM